MENQDSGLLYQKVLSYIEIIYDDFLRELCLKVYEKLKNHLLDSPASRNNHQNFKGGLLLHTLQMMEMAKSMTDSEWTNDINFDLVLAAIALHDVGKVLCYKKGYLDNRIPIYKSTDSRDLIGHTILSISLVECVVAHMKYEPTETYKQLQHCIVSHNGAWGDIKPQTKEAHLIHNLDMISAHVMI